MGASALKMAVCIFRMLVPTNKNTTIDISTALRTSNLIQYWHLFMFCIAWWSCKTKASRGRTQTPGRSVRCYCARFFTDEKAWGGDARHQWWDNILVIYIKIYKPILECNFIYEVIIGPNIFQFKIVEMSNHPHSARPFPIVLQCVEWCIIVTHFPCHQAHVPCTECIR